MPRFIVSIRRSRHDPTNDPEEPNDLERASSVFDPGKNFMNHTNQLSEQIIAQLAVDFVNLLVPGNFPSARAKLAPNCEYHYSGKLLTGDAIIGAFEESHERAKTELECIEYLPATLQAVDRNTVIVGVKDRIRSEGLEHVYSDRLSVTISESASDWTVTRLEHLPVEEERLKLRKFLDKLKSLRAKDWRSHGP